MNKNKIKQPSAPTAMMLLLDSPVDEDNCNCIHSVARMDGALKYNNRHNTASRSSINLRWFNCNIGDTELKVELNYFPKKILNYFLKKILYFFLKNNITQPLHIQSKCQLVAWDTVTR